MALSSPVDSLLIFLRAVSRGRLAAFACRSSDYTMSQNKELRLFSIKWLDFTRRIPMRPGCMQFQNPCIGKKTSKQLTKPLKYKEPRLSQLAGAGGGACRPPSSSKRTACIMTELRPPPPPCKLCKLCYLKPGNAEMDNKPKTQNVLTLHKHDPCIASLRRLQEKLKRNHCPPRTNSLVMFGIPF